MPRYAFVFVLLALVAFGCVPDPGDSTGDFTASLTTPSPTTPTTAGPGETQSSDQGNTTLGATSAPEGTGGGSGAPAPDLPDPCADLWSCYSAVSLDTISCKIECEQVFPGADEFVDCEFAACLSGCEEIQIAGDGECAEMWPVCSGYMPDPENCELVCQQDMTACLEYVPLCNENNPPYTGPCGLTLESCLGACAGNAPHE